MEKQFDVLVFIGRMQPFHNGHKTVIDKALEHTKEVVVVLGSCFQPRSIRNPFTFEERKAMIKAVFPQDNVKVVPVMDYPYDDNAWVTAVQSVVRGAVATNGWSDYPPKIGLIGHSKDHSSYYLKIFPDWRNHVEVKNVDGINATDIRMDFFAKGAMKPSLIPLDVWADLSNFYETDTYNALATEYSQIKEYREKSQMKGFNFPPVFVTTDAVVHQSGYILLIKRGGFPFKDCWALPGGYLDKGQFVTDNMIKELREETKLKIPEKVLKGSIRSVQVFDHPDRDPRGRVITHGFFVDLGFPDEKLPKVKGGDDAKHAEWVKLSDITSDMMAFDHFHVIKRFIPTYNK